MINPEEGPHMQNGAEANEQDRLGQQSWTWNNRGGNIISDHVNVRPLTFHALSWCILLGIYIDCKIVQ